MDLDKLKQSISDHEGLRTYPYTDSTGHISIGYGTNLSAGITENEAAYLRDNRIETAIDEAQAMPWWDKVSDNDARANAVIEILYNIGPVKFKSFVAANACLSAGDFAGASAEFLNSLWHQQVGRRAETLAAMIQTGQFADMLV